MTYRVRTFANYMLLVMLVLGTAACGASNSNSTTSGPGILAPSRLIAENPTSETHTGRRADTMPAANMAPPQVAKAPEADKYAAQPPAGMMASTPASAEGITGMAGATPSMSGPVEAFQDAGGTGLNTGRTAPAPNYQSSLTAGQVDDNAKFSDYLDYMGRYSLGDVHPIDVAQRMLVRVVDGAQHPVAGARVQLFDGERRVFDGQTVSDGRALFFPNSVGEAQAQHFHAVVNRGNTRVEADLAAGKPEQTVALGLGDNTGAVGLDLVFLLDATGSMDDEIAQIKGTVGSIASRIQQLPGSTAPRFGLVAFRDRGDDYVTHTWDFTGDSRQFAANLEGVQAGGGGDNPESVNAGLHDAINLPGWTQNESGRHLRMIVLVGDAPPHLDYPNDYEYTSLLKDAVQKGVQVFPIGASGLNEQGEYIFRQFAQVTQGQFIFMTYANGVSGAPGMATGNHVSDFTVQNLDNLVVSLVAGEVANQTGGKSGNGSGAGSQVLASVVDNIAPPPDDAAFTSMGGVRGAVQAAWTQLFSWSTVFWLLLLVGMLVAAYGGPRRMAVAMPSLFRARRATGDIEERGAPDADLTQAEGWEEGPTPVESVYSNGTPVRADLAAPQPTVPLPSLVPVGRRE